MSVGTTMGINVCQDDALLYLDGRLAT
jgi:hypothetical protein